MWYCTQQKKGYLYQRLRNDRATANKRAKAMTNAQTTIDEISEGMNDLVVEQTTEVDEIKLYFKHCLPNDADLKAKLAQTVQLRRQWLKDGAVIANTFGFFYTAPFELVCGFF